MGSPDATALLERQAAVGAAAIDERRGGPARGTRQVLVGLGELDRDRREAFAFEIASPFGAQQLTQGRQVVLLDQEVRLGPSAFSRAGRTPDQRRNSSVQATITQRFHVGDGPRHRGNKRNSLEELLRQTGSQIGHFSNGTAKFPWFESRKEAMIPGRSNLGEIAFTDRPSISVRSRNFLPERCQ